MASRSWPPKPPKGRPKGARRARGARLRIGLCGAGLVATFASSAGAQANYDGVMLGGRSSMMGGAAVAKGSDGATAFVNPAGLTRIPGESFSFSTFAVQMSSRSLRAPFDPSGALGVRDPEGHDFSVRILPNTFCLFLDGPPRDDYSGKSRHKYGVCVADAEKEEFLLGSNIRGSLSGGYFASNSLSTQMKFTRSSAAFAWGFEIESGTSIGVTARIDNTSLEDQTAVTAVAPFAGAADMQTMTLSRNSTSWDSSITVGLTHTVSQVVTLGASLSTPTQHLLGFHDGSEAFAPVRGGVRTLVQDRGDFRYNQPATLRLGLAFSWPTINFEINGNFYGAQDVLAQAKFNRTTSAVSADGTIEQSFARDSLVERSKPVVNLAAGVEAFLDSDFSLVAGIQTDFSGLERRVDARPAETLFRQRKDAIHASLGIASYGSQGSLLLGLRGYYAAGEILVADPTAQVPLFSPQTQSDWGLSFVVSGQISFRAVRDAAARAARPLVKIPGALEEEEEDTKEPEGAPKEQPQGAPERGGGS